MDYYHIPVMLKEVVDYLAPQPGDYVIDGTLGGGGYTRELARRVGPTGKVLAIDLDPLALNNAKKNLAAENLNNVILAEDNFRNLQNVILNNFPSAQKFNGLVFDLGLSSAQLSDSERGFSFKESAPLNMAFGPKNYNDTEKIINRFSAHELETIFREYGEERFAHWIAEAIVAARKAQPLTTTQQLVDIILQAVPKKFQHGGLHPATRVFQALRVATNEELESLQEMLPQAVAALKPGGRLVIVSFQSLEDRIVKHFFKNNSEVKLLHKKIIEPSPEEVRNNPRSRSAKLRAVEKL